MIEPAPALDALEALKARRYFGGHSVCDALRQAEVELASAQACECCRSVLAHLCERLGSTLFFDDDPEELARAFELEERDRYTPRLMAACILLHGRPREELFPRAR